MKRIVGLVVIVGALIIPGASSQAATVSQGGNAVVVTAPGTGGGPHVKVFDVASGMLTRQFYAYPAAFSGGVNVALGDVDGDGTADIVTGPGPGGGPHVKVFSGATGAVIKQFFAFDGTFQGGVYVAVADVTGDGKGDVIVGAGSGGGPHVKVFDVSPVAPSVVASFFAYDPAFRGGVRVSGADLDADGRAEVFTAAGPGGGPHVRAVRVGENPDSPPSSVLSLYPETPSYQGGLFVAAHRDSAGTVRIVAAPQDSMAQAYVRTFDASGHEIGQTYLSYDYPGTGNTVALGNVDGDPADEVTGGNTARGSRVITKDIHGDRTVFATDAYPGFAGVVSVAMG